MLLDPARIASGARRRVGRLTRGGPRPGVAGTSFVDDAGHDEVPGLGEVLDQFVDDRALGSVLGTTSTRRDGHVGPRAERQGVDAEGTIGIDNGALRFAPLRTPGWQRQGIAYGPFLRQAGLTLVVRALNSHHAAATDDRREGRKAALRRVVTEFPHGRLAAVPVKDSLAIGFQAAPVPADPRGVGTGFVMRTAGVVNGELTARVGTGQLRAQLGIEELPIVYVVVLRDRGAVYYVSSLPGAVGMAGHPAMRPVAVDHAENAAVVWASLQQAVHGEVGHQLATRIESVEVRHLAQLADPWAIASASDPLMGAGPLAGSRPLGHLGPVPGSWRVLSGAIERTPGGATGGEDGGLAVVDVGEASGLVHAIVVTADPSTEDGGVGLVWRAGHDGQDGWLVTLRSDEAELAVGTGGAWEVVARTPAHLPAAERSLQVLDDGRTMSVHLDGELLFDRWFEDERHQGNRGVGFMIGPTARAHLRDFEAHPRAVPLPVGLHLPEPWCPRGGETQAGDDFAGPAGELAGARGGPHRPGPAWARSFGRGHFDLTGAGSLRVRASRAAPNPGRTCYTFPWADPGFVDLGVTITPPGWGRGQGHGSRAGLVLWDSSDTHLIVNAWLDDSPDHDGSAISLFFRDRGYERLYDAPWANVGRRVTWGVPFRLHLVSDGNQVLVHVDDEPVLYRRTTDLYPDSPGVRLARVGLVANYEWGDDTGSRFDDFTAKGR